ncbi:ImmA/IrrE family metallo-endopeptidase [Rhodococcus hoagii]|nr:ImmA/IrrE family metallo-endopeptidase [Prescottella equi]NKV87466.1 ImmA/IrrE family metallo-endopeptidase [Prescottella equi]
MTASYNPWRDARDRYPDYLINFKRVLPPGMRGCIKGKTIHVCASLTQEARRFTLAHEVCHLDTGIFHTGDPRVELMIDRMAARRLITAEEFVDALAWSRRSHNECASELGVDGYTLKVWVQSLNKDERRYITALLRRRGEP